MFMPAAKVPATQLVRPRSLAGLFSRRREKCSPGPNTVGWTSCVHSAQTGTTSVGGWMDDPSDRRSISAHGGGNLAKKPGFGGAEL